MSEDYNSEELQKFDYPFQAKRLEENRLADKRETVNVSINLEERLWLNEIKRQLNTPMDSTALKEAAKVGLNVLHGTFGKDTLPWLLSSKRRKGDEKE